MSAFPARANGELRAEGVPLSAIAARFGTPCHVYSKAALVEAYRTFDAAFEGRDRLICYAVKANPNLAILSLFARLGAGFDIVSQGELERVLAAGGVASKTVFSGVGKSPAEMARALEVGVACFNVESAAELDVLAAVARAHGVTAPVSVRVNPDVDAGTHPYIATGLKSNKFGVPHQEAVALYRRCAGLGHLEPVGIDCHIGSQITQVEPFADALDRVLELVGEIERSGIPLRHLDLGGGVGIRYRDETPIPIDVYAQALRSRLDALPYRLVLEPGRSLVGAAGLLLTRVDYLKHGQERSFAIVDAAMNDLMRPALYDAYHPIEVVRDSAANARSYDVVGPVCESADFLGRDRELRIAAGDCLAVLCTGAYGSSMGSNYNSRARPAEVMVDGENVHLVRSREPLERLWEFESMLPENALPKHL